MVLEDETPTAGYADRGELRPRAEGIGPSECHGPEVGRKRTQE